MNDFEINLADASRYARAPSWPAEDRSLRSDQFFVVMAEACQAELNRPDLANRFLLFAEEMLSPKEQEDRRRSQRNELIRDLANDFYPATLGSNAKARIIADDLAQMRLSSEEGLAVRARPQNSLLREILELNDDEVTGLGFENVKKILRTLGNLEGHSVTQPHTENEGAKPWINWSDLKCSASEKLLRR